MRLHRLFHQLGLHALILQQTDDADRILGTPALICLDPDTDARSDGLADSQQTIHIFEPLLTDIHIQDAEAVLNGLHTVAQHLIDGIVADGVGSLDFPFRSAQYFVQRLAERFGI